MPASAVGEAAIARASMNVAAILISMMPPLACGQLAPRCADDRQLEVRSVLAVLVDGDERGEWALPRSLVVRCRSLLRDSGEIQTDTMTGRKHVRGRPDFHFVLLDHARLRQGGVRA